MSNSGQIVSETVTVSEPPFPPRVPSGPITVNKEFINNATEATSTTKRRSRSLLTSYSAKFRPATPDTLVHNIPMIME